MKKVNFLTFFLVGSDSNTPFFLKKKFFFYRRGQLYKPAAAEETEADRGYC